MRFRTDSSPLTRALTTPIKSLLIGALLLTPVATAYAADDTSPQEISKSQVSKKQVSKKQSSKKQVSKKQPSKKLKRQILASLDDPGLSLKSLSGSSQEALGSGFRLSKKGPIQYRRILQIGDDEVTIKFYGPIVKKNLGLRFRVEGFRIGDHPVQVEGFGNMKEAALRFTIRF